MSVATEDLELYSPITQGTRLVSKVNQICTIIDELLLQRQEQDKDQSYITVSLPKGVGLSNVDVHVLERVHAKYLAERVGDDIFIKYDGINKENMHYNLKSSALAHNPNWLVSNNAICVIGGAERRPDVGVWINTRPTFAQRSRPIVNACPAPDVYIELFFNRDSNRSKALARINFAQQHTNSEFVGICIPDLANGIQANPNPQQASVLAVPEANQNARPTRAPYIIHWDVNNNPIYYGMQWNRHILLRCGWRIDFNAVLIELV